MAVKDIISHITHSVTTPTQTKDTQAKQRTPSQTRASAKKGESSRKSAQNLKAKSSSQTNLAKPDTQHPNFSQTPKGKSNKTSS